MPDEIPIIGSDPQTLQVSVIECCGIILPPESKFSVKLRASMFPPDATGYPQTRRLVPLEALEAAAHEIDLLRAAQTGPSSPPSVIVSEAMP